MPGSTELPAGAKTPVVVLNRALLDVGTPVSSFAWTMPSMLASVHQDVPVQLPLVQVLVAWLVPGQAALHPPQLATEVLVLISQPSLRRFELQSAKPDAQVPVQAPAMQVLMD